MVELTFTVDQRNKLEALAESWKKDLLLTTPTEKDSVRDSIQYIYKSKKLQYPKIIWVQDPTYEPLSYIKNRIGLPQCASEVPFARRLSSMVYTEVRFLLSQIEPYLAEIKPSVIRHSRDYLTLISAEFFSSVYGTKPEQEQKVLSEYLNLVRNTSGFLLCRDLCFMVFHPSEFYLNRNGRLHNETGTAITFSSGLSYYYLNGIRMKPEYVILMADEISPNAVIKEKDIGQRRELVRKLGVMCLKGLGKPIEKTDGYELIDMKELFPNLTYVPYLLMKSLSVENTWHFEAVGPECYTIKEAINWRAGNAEVDWTPDLLS